MTYIPGERKRGERWKDTRQRDLKRVWTEGSERWLGNGQRDVTYRKITSNTGDPI